MDPTPWAVAAFLLLGLLAQALLHADPVPLAAAGRARPLAAGALPGAARLDLPPYPSLLQRPLFAAGPVGGTGGAQAETTVAFSLLGLASDGVQASAVIRGGDGAVYAVKRGQTVLGWRLAAAGAGRALLVRGGEAKMLVLGAAPPRETPLPGERP